MQIFTQKYNVKNKTKLKNKKILKKKEEKESTYCSSSRGLCSYYLIHCKTKRHLKTTWEFFFFSYSGWCSQVSLHLQPIPYQYFCHQMFRGSGFDILSKLCHQWILLILFLIESIVKERAVIRRRTIFFLVLTTIYT